MANINVTLAWIKTKYKLHPKLFGPLILILLLIILYITAPAPYPLEKPYPENNSYVEIIPSTKLCWQGGTPDSPLIWLVSLVKSILQRQPPSRHMIYNVYIGKSDIYHLAYIGSTEIVGGSNDDIICHDLPQIESDTKYYWRISAINDLNKETRGPIWVFNTTNINQPPHILDLISDPQSPQSPGTKINWTAIADDSEKDPIDYKFKINGKDITGWTSSNIFTWTTSVKNGGIYNITVCVRDRKHAPLESSDDTKFREFEINKMHKIKNIVFSKDQFTIDEIWGQDRKFLNINDLFTYSRNGVASGAPLSASGKTQLKDDTYIWAVVVDQFGHFYLQSPPLNVRSGSWRGDNIRPLEEAVRIEFIKVDESGNPLFEGKVQRGEWGNFSLKSKYEILGDIELM